MVSARRVGKGCVVALFGDRVYVVRVGELAKIKGLGVINTSMLEGKEFGDRVKIGEKEYTILPPSIQDMYSSLQRKSQIITAKDAAFIAYLCDIRPGSLVVEGGIGTGAMCIYLAAHVRPDGMVYSYDIRKDMIDVAMANIKRYGLEKYVVVKNADITTGIDEKDVDAVVLDIPEPWSAVDKAYASLRTGGYLCSYVPTMNQAEDCADAMREVGFCDVKCYELLLREIVARKGRTRPSFDMLGHTGYIITGRKISP